METCFGRLGKEAICPGIATEGVVRRESVKETTAEMDTPEAPKEQTNDTGNSPWRTIRAKSEADCSASPSKLQLHQSEMDTMELEASSKAIFPVVVSQDSFETLAEKVGSSPSTPENWFADLDCLICCNQYSPGRLPKLLACQHIFCAVCLKLLVQNKDNTWKIVCPICRKATTVFGGLVCSLPNQEDLLGHSANAGPKPEELFSLDAPHGLQLAPRIFYIHQEDDIHTQAATKRLLFLLLLLLLLIILVLPFVYSGMLKWALCLALLLGVAMAGVLCFNPDQSCCRPDISLPSWPKRESHIASIA